MLFLLWLCLFILSGVIPPLFSSSILDTYRPGWFIFQCPVFLPFHTVHGVLKARILKWFLSSSPVDHVLSELSAMTRPSCVAVHGMAHSFTDLDKAVIHMISLVSFLWLWFSFFGSDHELLIAKFRLKLKKVGKTTRPFRCDLNQILYTVEVRNRFRGLDLIDSAWRTMDGGSWHCTGHSNQNHRQEKEMQKAKEFSDEALQIAVKRREVKSKREKDR